MRLNNAAVPTLLLTMATMSVQITGLKFVAYGLLTGTLLTLSCIYTLAWRANRGMLLLFFFAFIFIVYQLRVVSFSGYGGVTDFLSLLPALLAILTVALGVQVKRELLIKTIVIGATVIAGLVIALHLANLYPSFLVSLPYAGSRWLGGFDGPNEFAQFYVLVIALALGLHKEKKIGTVFLLGVVAVLFFAIWNSFSRGAIATLILCFSLYFLINARSYKFWLGIAMILVVVVFQVEEILEAISYFSEVRQSSTDRFYLVREAIEVGVQNPALGGGYGYFNYASSVRNTTPHSDILYFFVSGGLVALILLAMFFGWLILNLFRRRCYCEVLFFSAFLMHALTWNNLVRIRVSILFVVILIVSLVAVRDKISVGTESAVGK